MIEKLKDDSLREWAKAATADSTAEFATGALFHMVAELRLAVRTSNNLHHDVLKIIDEVNHLTTTRARQSIRT